MEELIPALGAILLVFAVVLNVLLAFLVYRSDPRSATNRIYGLLGVVISIWLVANFISIQTQFLTSSLAWVILSFLFAVPLNVLFFLFAHTFPNVHVRLKQSFLFVLFFLASGISVVILSPLTFQGVEIVNGEPSPVFGPGTLLFGIFSIVLNVAAVILLIKKYHRTKPEERKPIGLVLWGTLLMFGFIISTIFIPTAIFKTNIFVPFMPLYTLIFLGMTAYGIVKHHLFNIKVVATEALVVVIWIILFSRILFARSIADGFIDSLVFVGTVLFGIILIRSVFKEIEQRERLEILTGQLEELNEMKSNFVSIASHQLRAPIGGIRSYLAMLKDGDLGPVTPKQQEIIQMNMEELRHMLAVIQMFLDVTKMESGKIELERKPTDLKVMASEVVAELEQSAKRKGLTLKTTLAAVPKVSLDAERMRNVVLNLIENAVKYTEKGSVEVGLRRVNGKVEFRVKDSGIGIAPDEIPKLFAKFVRAGGGFKVSHGSGLGLYIVKTLIEAHGGEAFVESPGVGKGSTFGFRLPIK